ncbi:MAG: hypothetical protein ACEPO2_07240 [Pelagibaca sp.]
MNVKLEDWAVNARTAALILNAPLNTLKMWRYRDNLLPQNWVGPGRAPEKCYQLRDLIQVRVAQKLMSVGVPVSKACQAANVSHMEPFFRGEQYTFGIGDEGLRVEYDRDNDVVLSFYLEKDGLRLARAVSDDIAQHRGTDVGDAALDDFLSEHGFAKS